jgi:hypothetical protein
MLWAATPVVGGAQAAITSVFEKSRPTNNSGRPRVIANT